jgi:hypothetical protein
MLTLDLTDIFFPFRFDWGAEALRAKVLIAAGEVDFDLEDVST